MLDTMWYLKRINIFSGLGERELDRLNESMVVKSFPKNSLIYTPEKNENQIYFLKQGKAKLYKINEQGKELTLTILSEGEAFGGITLNDSDGYNEYAETLEYCCVCAIEKNEFLQITNDNPMIHVRLNKLLGLRVMELQMKLEEMIFKTVQQRVVSLLIRLHDKYGTKKMIHHLVDGAALKTKVQPQVMDLEPLNISLSHYDIATMIGATREATTVALDKLKQQGVIEIQRRNIYIKNLEGLLALHN